MHDDFPSPQSVTTAVQSGADDPGKVTPRPADPSQTVAATAQEPRKRHAQRAKSNRLFLLFITLTAATLVQAIPILQYGTWSAPIWMRAILLLCLLELGVWVWMMLVPDWSTLWLATLTGAGACALYSFALAQASMVPEGQSDVLGMDGLRELSQLWSSAMLVMSGVLTLACGQTCFQWKKDARGQRLVGSD